jgi:formyl-CoA transferase
MLDEGAAMGTVVGRGYAGTMTTLPLADLRVLDISSLYAAPLAATMLADFGADVVKVEPPGGDSFRGTRMWPLVARGKRSVVLDPRSEDDRASLRALAASADVLVENLPAALLVERGLDWATLSALNPRLIMLSVSCFGRTGPYAERPGSGTIGEAFAGLTDLTGPAEGAPTLSSVALGDCVGAMGAVIGVLTALHARGSSGRGQQVDASLFEPILQIVAHAMPRWSPGASPRRSGSKLAGVLRNVYAAEDGFVALSASTKRHQRELCQLAGGTGAESDAEGDPLVAAWIRARPVAAVIEVLVARRIPATPVMDLDALLADPQVKARASLIRESDPELGELLMAGPFPRLVDTPGCPGPANPPLGGASADGVLRDWSALQPQSQATGSVFRPQ